jgi:hypothetical protein
MTQFNKRRSLSGPAGADPSLLRTAFPHIPWNSVHNRKLTFFHSSHGYLP